MKHHHVNLAIFTETRRRRQEEEDKKKRQEETIDG